MFPVLWPGPIAVGTQVEQATSYVSQAKRPGGTVYRVPPVKRITS